MLSLREGLLEDAWVSGTELAASTDVEKAAAELAPPRAEAGGERSGASSAGTSSFRPWAAARAVRASHSLRDAASTWSSSASSSAFLASSEAMRASSSTFSASTEATADRS